MSSFFLCFCNSLEKSTTASDSKDYRTEKGLLAIYDDRAPGHGNLSIARFYPLKDSSYVLTTDNFKIAEYDTGFAVGGISGVLRHRLINDFGERDILKDNHFYGLPIELKYYMSGHLNSEKDPIQEETAGSKMRQRNLYYQHTVTFIDYRSVQK